MSISVTIYDFRTNKEFKSKTDKLPVDKIIKTPDITLHCICFELKNDAIVINYHFNEVFNNQKSFRKYIYPEVELNDTVIDDLIDLIYTKLYDPDALYISGDNIEYPQDAILDIYNNIIKYKKDYKLKLEISFEEKEKPKLTGKVKELLLSPEPYFECPEEYKHINWADCLNFQPDKLIVDKIDDIFLLCFTKTKLGLIVYKYYRESEEIDIKSNYFTINKVGSENTIIDENLVIDKVEFSDCIIFKTNKNTFIKSKRILEAKLQN